MKLTSFTNTPLNSLKVALFYDRLNTWGGAERLFLDILKIYPQADIFTTVYDPEKTTWLPKNKIFHTRLNGPIFQKMQALFSPIYPILLEKYNFDNYNLVISLGSLFNNCLLTKPKTKYISYCLTPNRYLYQKKYFRFYKVFDYIYAQRPDCFFSISHTVALRIKDCYKRDSQIIYPSVNTKFFIPQKTSNSNDYYLAVSRLVPHKRVDLTIKSCLGLNKKLVIVGEGREATKLKSIAKNSTLIRFIPKVNEQELLKYYQNCKALISPQEEDFGLANLEAMACGKPVIAYASGGNSETILHQKTGYLFKHQDQGTLEQAILNFEKVKLNADDCRTQALKFSQENFMLNFTKHVNEILKN